MDTFLTDYIKAIENPNKIGWNGKVWAAPTLEGYDKNQRGYGIDIKRNIEARNLTKDRLGQWITEKEADTLMNNHLKYIEGVAKRRIKGFDNFSKEKLAAILGMLYRGDSVQSNVNINEPDDMKFLDSVHTYYKSKGLNERASNSENFFLNKTKKRNMPIVDYSFSEYSLPQDNTIVKKPIVFNKLGGYIRKMLTAAGGPLFPWLKQDTELIDNWKYKLTPASRSRVLSGKGVETDKQYTKRRIKETTKRTWMSDAADIAHGIREGVLALHPYTAIPYYGAKVGLDILNGNVNWGTALNLSVPLFHFTPQAVGLREATNVALEDAANAGSKTARNWRVAREINLATKSKPNISNRTISVKRSNNEITGQPDLVYTLYNEFGEPIGLTNIGGAVFGSGNKTHRMVDGVMSMRNAHKVSEDTYNAAVQDIIDNGGKGLESGWSLMMPQKTLAVTSKFPHTVIGLEFGNPVRLLTGTSKRPIPQRVLGNHYLELKPSFEIKYNESTGNFEQIPVSNSEPYVSTSLKFFERKPSKISLAERLGISKGDRNLPFKQKLPTEHIQGEEAVKMFKEYGGTPIPEGSINGEQLRKYVAEARERYGLVGNNNVTDEEIALALYKHSKELGGNTAAVNALGEPLLLFRGDTRRYTQLKERISPEELAKKSGTMDNSLGNLFLGEFPDSWRGVDRYIGTWRNFNGSPKLVGSGTGSKVVWDGKTASEIEGYPYLGPLAGGGYKLYSQPHRYGNIDVYKLPASMMESGVNDLNAFIVRTPQMRNASSEISVLNDDWMLQGAKDSHFMSKNYKYNPKTYSMENVKTGESLGEITTESAPESRAAMGDHYKELLKEAEQKQLGLLKSEANAPLRDEHSLYSYFALPNFNIQGAKHLLPYDLRIPRNWKDKNIYRGLIPLTTGYTLYNLLNQPLPQLQYQKQGGKMNIINLFKEGGQIRKMQTAAGGPIKKFRTKDVNGNWVYMDISTGRTTSAAPESGTIRTNTVNSIGGDVKTKLGRTRIALNQVTSYNNRQYKVHNYADTRTRLQLKNQDVVLDKQGEPKIVQADYTPTLEAPMKIVSPEFDLLTLGRLAVTSAYNAAKPTINVMADTAPEVKSATTLSLEQIEKAFNQARQWHLNRINSPGYKDRALRAGFTEEEIPQLLQLLTRLINRLKLLKPEEVLGSNIRLNHNLNGKPSAGYWRTNLNGDLKQGISFYDSNMSYDDAVSSFIHEFGHGATFGLNGTETSGYMKALADQFPLINRAVKYNRSLYPEINVGRVELAAPGSIRTGNVGYFASPTEMLSRGYEFMRDYGNNWVKAYKSGELPSKTHLDLVGSRENSNIFNTIATPKGAANFLRNALGISVPLGLGGYGLYNNDNYLQQLQYLKQGGMLEFLKNGSGIHIKKKNRGKFTSYCGGKVTDECIRKAKASGNPTLVKRATFAANARHFKHKSGGQIVQEFKRIRKNSLGGFLLGNMDKIQALAGTLGNYINNEKKIPQNPFNGMTAEWLINKKNNPSYNTLEQYPDALTSPMEAFYTLPNNNEELVYLRNLKNAFDIYKDLLKQKNTEALISGIGDFAKSFITK